MRKKERKKSGIGERTGKSKKGISKIIKNKKKRKKKEKKKKKKRKKKEKKRINHKKNQKKKKSKTSATSSKQIINNQSRSTIWDGILIDFNFIFSIFFFVF